VFVQASMFVQAGMFVQAVMFVQAIVFVTYIRKDTSLLRNLAIKCNVFLVQAPGRNFIKHFSQTFMLQRVS
jgi:hypothetical protein